MGDRRGFFALFFSVWVIGGHAVAADLVVDADFPGGSAEVAEIDQKKRIIRLNPTKHGDRDRGWACWWYCQVSGIAPGETITLDVGDAPWATPDRATWSADEKTWIHTAPGKREGKRIRYQMAPGADSIWIAWGPPFVLEDAKALVERASKHPAAVAFTLCETREGRETPAVRVTGAKDTPERIGIWVQARQHAWESGASWVGKGFLDWLVSDDEQAAELRSKSLVTFVPIMDIDNVERGAGGKAQKPQDHNRDWTAAPHWNSVRAAQGAILRQDKEKRFDVFIDLHNPGAGDRAPYYYVPPDELLSATGKRNLAEFIAASKTEIAGPLAFKGRAIASGSNYDAKAWFAISKNWVAANTRDHVVAVTLETAWNTPESTVSGYEQVGRELGKAVTRYLRGDTRKAAPKD